MSLNKFYTLENLEKVLKEKRKKKKIIALADNGFDLIHIGHIRYLKEAKKTADILVVALNFDESLKRVKGHKRPILDEKERTRIIASFECVDYVTVFDESTIDNLLLTLKPDFLCKGSDYTVNTVPGRETVKSYEGKIAIVGGDKIRNISEIVKEIRSRENEG
jgi:D-beta-D-heptose 7-phosphate kinase/D-beta-D-heptose 1-phosphate adenosyltransferase